MCAFWFWWLVGLFLRWVGTVGNARAQQLYISPSCLLYCCLTTTHRALPAATAIRTAHLRFAFCFCYLYLLSLYPFTHLQRALFFSYHILQRTAFCLFTPPTTCIYHATHYIPFHRGLVGFAFLTLPTTTRCLHLPHAVPPHLLPTFPAPHAIWWWLARVEDRTGRKDKWRSLGLPFLPGLVAWQHSLSLLTFLPAIVFSSLSLSSIPYLFLFSVCHLFSIPTYDISPFHTHTHTCAWWMVDVVCVFMPFGLPSSSMCAYHPLLPYVYLLLPRAPLPPPFTTICGGGCILEGC